MTTSLVLSFVFIFVIQALFFSWAVGNASDKLTDLAYGGTFVVVALAFLVLNSTYFVPQVIIATLVTIWGLRLAVYLFVRINKIGRDKRFDGIRENFFAFGKFWLLQAIAIWIIMLPASLVLNSRINIVNNFYLILGVVVWVIGFYFETVADWQKFNFKNKKSNKNKFIKTGLWKISRHPNYFGEILVWWGIFIIALPVIFTDPLNWLTILGPIFISFLLIFVTGIPPLEKRYAKKFENNNNYKDYKKNTPTLIPFLKF